MARINKTRFRTDYEQSFVLFKCFRGANTKQLDYYVVPLLVREKLRTMIIHMCSNEITKMNYENVNVEDLTQHVVSIGNKCRSFDVNKIAISSILLRNPNLQNLTNIFQSLV